jgi:gliding motility-associated-like protein
MVPINETGTTVSNNSPSFSWDFGNGAILNTNPADYTYPAPGNYTVKFTVTDTIGCVRIDSQHVHIVQVTVQTATHDTSICLSDSLMLNSSVTIVPDAIDYTTAWTPTNNIGNTSTSSTNFFGLGDYVYTVTASTIYPACTATDTEAIHSYPPVTLTNLTASQTIPWGSTIQLNADGAVYYNWAPSNGTLSNPNINDPVAAPIDSVTKYTVYGMSLYGCLDSASLTISMGTMTQFVPSAFTPNGDGLNDVFRIVNTTFQKLVDFRVFNRWGQQVFQTSNREMGWDGTFNGVPQDMGVYSYEITIGLVDGTNKTYKGTVTLIR